MPRLGPPLHRCPCGADASYAGCCGRFLDTNQFPATAEALMRSRYVAYVQPLLFDTVEKVRKRLNTRLNIFGVLPTMYNARNLHDNDCLTELKEILGSRIPLFEPIHRSTGFDRSSAMGKATLDAFPDTPGVAVYHHIANELISHGES